jgi:hypothetical protein
MASIANVHAKARTAGRLSDYQQILNNRLTVGLFFIAVEGSAIGQQLAPVDTGLLKATVKPEQPKMGDLSGSVRWGSPLYYSRYQELGTSKMAAQPYLKPSLDKMRVIGPGMLGRMITTGRKD